MLDVDADDFEMRNRIDGLDGQPLLSDSISMVLLCTTLLGGISHEPHALLSVRRFNMESPLYRELNKALRNRKRTEWLLLL